MTAELGELRWPDLLGRRPLVVVPVGSIEQHGPHLPLNTDSAVAEHVARGLLAAAGGAQADEPAVVLAPTLAYGASGEHEGFPGTISIGHEALRSIVLELGRSISGWADRLLLVNGHGGNLRGLISAVRRLRYEGRDAAWWACAAVGSDAHAGRSETAMLLALRPGSVLLGNAVAGRTEPVRELIPSIAASSVRAVSPNGVLGDPAGASADEGRDLLGGMITALIAAVGAWQVGDHGGLHAAGGAG